MKKKIFWKLAACFGAALLVFSIATCLVFIVLFKQYTIVLHRSDMEERAVGVAEVYGEFLMTYPSDPNTGHNNDIHLSFFDALSRADVWIIDGNRELITHGGYTRQQLSTDVEQMIDRVFVGETVFSEAFSEVLQIPMLTVGVPVYDARGGVSGAVLLHTPIDGIDTAISRGLSIFAVSVFAALLLTAAIALILSYFFTKPLHKMELTALRLTDGDYTARTGVTQHDEFGRLARTMDLLAARLSQVSQEKDRLEQMRQDFVTNVSHELRTPVTVLRGSMESLRDGIISEPGEIKQCLDEMVTESVILERLVNDFLELSRLQNTDFSIEMLPLNLCDVASDVVRGMRRVARQKKISIEVTNPYAEFWVTGDYGRIRQMLLIVLDNAVKFSVSGQVVTMELEGQAFDKMVLRITDSGVGIPAEELPYIFGRFRKSQADSNRGGTGLGLAIARQIAVRHGIEITVASEENVRTEFSFLFHANPVASERGHQEQHLSQTGGGGV